MQYLRLLAVATVLVSVIDIGFVTMAAAQQSTTSSVVLAVHGGAGGLQEGDISDEREAAYRSALREALEAGHAVLRNGGTSLDAVEASLRHLEDDSLFNAGKGAVLTHEGTAELDASIMEGKIRNAGAVAAVKHVKNPVTAARLVMEASSHVMLAGEGADTFAREHGLDVVPNDYFITERRRRLLERVRQQESGSPTGANRPSGEVEPFPYGTVGAVAVDREGTLAAGTSTGGRTNKRFGRVGDSPIIGAGTYAQNETCAVSATGHGEYFMRGVIAYDVAAMMQYAGLPLAQAANAVIHGTLTEMGGTGGVIALDRHGNVAMPFNTRSMFRGTITDDGTVDVKLYRDE